MRLDRAAAFFGAAVGLLTLAALWRNAGVMARRNVQLAGQAEAIKRQAESIEEHTTQLDHQTRNLEEHGDLLVALGNLMFALNPEHDPAKQALHERKKPIAMDAWKEMVQKRANRR